jgi:hypothetical protein
MTDTLERSETFERVDGSSTRSPWVIALVSLVVLAAGAVVGWVIRGASEDESAVAVVTADGSELTTEQEQMWGMLEQYVDELSNGDYEAAESWFSNDGGIRVVDGFDVPYGQFVAMLPDAPWEIDRLLGTALIFEDRIVFFHVDINDMVRADVVRFGDFDNGEFHIEEHLVTD